MRSSDAEIRAALAGVRGALSPVLAIKGHGLERACTELAHTAREHHAAARAAGASAEPEQEALALDGPLHERAEELRSALLGLSARLLRVALGVESDAEAEARAGRLEGRLCLRRYPQRGGEAAAPRLGAHIDSTVLTLLWANGPGLEVLMPRDGRGGEEGEGGEGGEGGRWTAEQVLGLGLPTASAVELREAREDEWACVELPWEEGALILTVGLEWLECAPLRERMPMECAVLHRVAVPGGRQERLSLPFLVNLRRGPGGGAGGGG